MTDPTHDTPAEPAPRRFGRRFAVLFGAGVLGVLALVPTLPEMLRNLPVPPEVRLPPLPVMVALSLVQPLLLLAGGVALGLVLAPRLGLRSHLAERAAGGPPVLRALRGEVGIAVALGVAADAVVLALELGVFQPWMGEAGRALAEGSYTPTLLLAGLLYGGITEELMVRWGVLSLLAWAGWKLLQRGQGPPRAGVMWGAILLSALLFGAGHLGAAAAFAPLTPAVVARTVVLNAVAGVAFGWLYWRRSLEAAMVAHMAAHLALALTDWAGIVPG